MEKVINIGDKEVKFRATAGVLSRYRTYFNRDFLKDLMELTKKLEKLKSPEEQMESINLEVFEKIAWTMAKTADSTIPPIDEWLDNFDTFGIIKILPELVELMVSNMSQQNESKKKLEEVAGN